MSPGPIIVGPYTVDANKCSHTTDGPHFCVHDWRINGSEPGAYFGNVDRTGED